MFFLSRVMIPKKDENLTVYRFRDLVTWDGTHFIATTLCLLVIILLIFQKAVFFRMADRLQRRTEKLNEYGNRNINPSILNGFKRV